MLVFLETFGGIAALAFCFKCLFLDPKVAQTLVEYFALLVPFSVQQNLWNIEMLFIFRMLLAQEPNVRFPLC